MGFDLENDKGTALRWNGVWWRLMLNTARYYGWQPTGTQLQVAAGEKPWDGSYSTNDGQLVLSGDASALAAALRRALVAPDLEDVANRIHEAYVTSARKEADRVIAALGLSEEDEEPAPPIERIRLHELKKPFEEFAAFCDAGAFRIL
jgi:hypothetical protein